MNRYFLLFAFCGTQAYAAFNPITTDIPPDLTDFQELILLDSLIDVTENNLALQKELRKDLQVYGQRKNRFLKDMDNREAAYDMVQSAHLILEIINSNYLLQMFSPDFISELTFFSQIASKK